MTSCASNLRRTSWLVAGLLAACFTTTQARAASQPQYMNVNMQSRLLSAFWGQPVSLHAHVFLPDSYYSEPQKRYPVFYWIQGFDGYGDPNARETLEWQRPMRRMHQEYILVFLDGMFNDGHQEFADSANNGPWGAALTTEFVPQTDAHFRTFGTSQTRFVGGHSSGGWSALWLQITYPDVFGGEWSLSPDPVDFRDFLGMDLTRVPPPNAFVDASGRARDFDGESFRKYLLDYEWSRRQIASFDAVFSPQGKDEKAERLFDPGSGQVDESVAQYWEAHYDIARILREDWSTLGPKLQGKIHIIVGTKDNFDLEKPVALLENELRTLGSDAEIDFAGGANHWTVMRWHGDAIDYILTEASAELR